MTVKPLVAWYDFWIGAFWDSARRRLYVLPLSCIGVVIQFKPRATPAAAAKTPVPIHVLAALERAIQANEKDARALMRNLDYSAQFPELDAMALRRIHGLLVADASLDE